MSETASSIPSTSPAQSTPARTPQLNERSVPAKKRSRKRLSSITLYFRPRSIGSIETIDTLDDPESHKEFGTKFPIVVEFIISLWYLLISNTDTICYILVFVNQVFSASVLSLPLPLMVLLWGTLSLPRPSKNFWVALIVYTQILVLLKFLFQFQFWPWVNDVVLDNEPFAPVRILGIEQRAGYATFDLLLLLALFWHVIILKSLGLWNENDILHNETDLNER